MTDNGRLVLTSEFASVAVELDTDANGPRLRIENQQNRRVVYLDPLELASLTWLTHEHLPEIGVCLQHRSGWMAVWDRIERII